LSAAADIVDAVAAQRARRVSRLRNLNVLGFIATVATVLAAVLCAFPLYWGLITTFKPEDEILRPGVQLWPEHFTFQNYVHVLTRTKIGVWYLNSLVTSAAVTIIVVGMAAGAGYAISQLNFPGRRIFWGLIFASFMVPIPALVITHFVLMSQFHWINTWAGVIAPQLIAQVHDAFGVSYGRDLAVAMLAALPVAIVYLIFQRQVTQAIMLSAGIKG